VSTGEDEYNTQKKFVGQLCTAAKDLNIHIHLIHHSRKRDNEKTRPGKQDTNGTGAIVDQTDNFFADFKAPDDDRGDGKPDFVLYLDKQRNGEWEGGIGLWFSPDFALSWRSARVVCALVMTASGFQ
jgi:twinkle protein